MNTPIWYDWLIIFFVHEISEDLPESKEMYEIIEKTGSGDNNAIFLIKDKISADEKTLTFEFKLSVSRLVRKASGKGWQFCKETDFHFNNKEKNCWKRAFQYVYSNYFSERKLLVTFSHGAAFGINRNTDRVARAARVGTPGAGTTAATAATPTTAGAATDTSVHNGFRRSARKITAVTNQRYVLDKEDIKRLEKRGWKPEGQNILRCLKNANAYVVEKDPNAPACKSLNILWVSDLADALTEYLFDSSIDVMLMVNCYMQLFDNGYLLSGAVKYMVAPEGEMWATGYDYKSLLLTLRDKPGISNKVLVKKIVKDYEGMYTRQKETSYLRQTTLFANDLRYYNIALKGFETFVEGIRGRLKLDFDAFREIRENQLQIVSDSTSYQLIDARSWISLVGKKLSEVPEISEFEKWFVALSKRIVVAKFVGQDFLVSDRVNTAKYGYSGISLYYPINMQQITEQEVAWCAYFDRSVSSKFNKRSNWAKFLDAYMRLSRSAPATSPPPAVQDHSPVFGGILSPLPSAGISNVPSVVLNVSTSL